MPAKDGRRRDPTTPTPPLRGMVVGLACLGLMAGGCSSMFRPAPRPSIEQLIEEALVTSAEKRHQKATLVDKRVDPSSGVELAQAELPLPAPHELPPLAKNGDDPNEPIAVLNEEFIDIDVREAVSILAAEAGADVLMDDQVRGVVNTTIEDATFNEALEKVLLPLGFVVGRRGAQYIVCPPDPDSPLFPFVSTQLEYRPLYHEAKQLLAAPPRQMLRFVRVVEEANLLVIEAPTQYAGLILDRIRRLDQPVPQVELEAIICVVSPDSSFRFGLDWGHAVELDGEQALRLGMTGLGISGAVSPIGLRNAFSDFATTSAFVNLLAENGYLTIRASPRVMAEDGKKANISIGQTTYFSAQPLNSGAANSTVFFQQDIRDIDSGIELVFTPRVRGDTVTLDIEKAEVSEDITDNTNNLSLPVINRRNVSTTVHVQDGKTIVIGGLVQRETVDRANRVPGLSRLPGVGYLFRSVERQAREAEVVIFIAPRIVQPAECVAGCDTPPMTPPQVGHDALQLPETMLAHP